jgi:hypothetical protein
MNMLNRKEKSAQWNQRDALFIQFTKN